jgi:hypothetical protein
VTPSRRDPTIIAQLMTIQNSAWAAHPFIGLWGGTDAYSVASDSASLLRPAISTGTPRRNRGIETVGRQPSLAHRMGLLHLRQRGGGMFLTIMVLTLNWAGAQNSQSP